MTAGLAPASRQRDRGVSGSRAAAVGSLATAIARPVAVLSAAVDGLVHAGTVTSLVLCEGGQTAGAASLASIQLTGGGRLHQLVVAWRVCRFRAWWRRRGDRRQVRFLRKSVGVESVRRLGAFGRSLSGAPVLAGTLGWLDCELLADGALGMAQRIVSGRVVTAGGFEGGIAVIRRLGRYAPLLPG